MVKIKKIDHVAICVPDIAAAAARWRALFGVGGAARDGEAAGGSAGGEAAGAAPGEAAAVEWVEEQKTNALLLPIGETHLELISPHGNEGLERFLDKRGPGLHHVALEVEGLESAIALLVALGVPMIDTAPRVGARGHRVAFVHPKATGGVLVELVESAAHP